MMTLIKKLFWASIIIFLALGVILDKDVDIWRRIGYAVYGLFLGSMWVILVGRIEVKLPSFKKKKYNIWSNEHGSWWGVHSQGYVENRQLAGVYSEKEAREIVEGANKYLPKEALPNEVMVDVDSDLYEFVLKEDK